MLAPELGIIMPAACTARDRYHAEIASPWAVTASPWAVTYGRHDVAGKLVVDAGAGSGMQSRWMREAGARRVIVLELSHSVDGVMSQNLRGLDGVDIVQCSIDRPPLKDGCIDGIVICHNVIQHTPSVETTARALWALVAPGGEFAFNCYLQNTFSAPRRFRFWLYQRLCFVVRGEVPPGPHRLRRAYRIAVLNTFDWYGTHEYQHHKTREEIERLVKGLQPDASKVSNLEGYLRIPAPPVGYAIRIAR